jgi:hypothetical protein
MIAGSISLLRLAPALAPCPPSLLSAAHDMPAAAVQMSLGRSLMVVVRAMMSRRPAEMIKSVRGVQEQQV